ncbi:DsbA family protein [uncultured Planktomarina sp.]|jgi:protein-disulfide isomerase|uniref:DsbA family protein n=1 Tax=uncultured Planktomarina sp. TaxID=1538529 RepID=UPI003261C171
MKRDLEMKKTYVIGLAFILALGIGAYMVKAPTPSGLTAPGFGAANATEAGEIDTSSILEMTLGAEDAPIQMTEYASFTCPHCRTFHKDVFQKLKADYIDTDKLHFTYREIYFDRYGLWGSIVARCGGADKFFAISDLLYTKQAEWTKGTPAKIAENLRRIGITAGLSQKDVQSCFTDGEKAQNLVAWYEANQAEDEISSTPSFIINGAKYSNMSYAELQKILDAQ